MEKIKKLKGVTPSAKNLDVSPIDQQTVKNVTDQATMQQLKEDPKPGHSPIPKNKVK